MHSNGHSRVEARRGLGYIIAAALLWGTVGVTTQAIAGLAATNAASVGFFRLALATPVLLVALWRQSGWQALRVPRRDLAVMALIGLMLGFYQLCYFLAIAYTGVAIAALVTLCTAPVMVALLAMALTRERVSGRVVLALVCALAGTALLVGFQPHTRLPQTALAGILLALCSAFGYAVITISGRLLAQRYHPLQVTSVGFVTGSLLLLSLALAQGFVVSYPAPGWGLLLYLGIVPTALAYGLFLTGMRSTSATVASIVTLLEPLTATLLAWTLFGERLGPLGLLGGLCLLGAVGMLYWSDKVTR